MRGIAIGVAAGILGHQLDAVFRRLEGGNTPSSWLLLSRYGTGTFLVIGTLALTLDDHEERQTVTLKALASAVSVGVGVSAGHLIDYLRES